MKPKYTIPTMKEIEQVPKNGLKVISTFSGCGGSCLGYEMAGFEVVWANEFEPRARKTYQANHKGVILNSEDIRNLTGATVLKEAGMVQGEPDVLEGSPPCSGFSTSGKRERAWGTEKKYSGNTGRVQRNVEDLFYDFSRIVDEVQPKVFTAENVKGLISGVSRGYFKEIMRMLKGNGYRVKARVLDASRLGCATKRERVFFVGVREDLQIEPPHPKPLPYTYILRDAIYPQIKGLHHKHGRDTETFKLWEWAKGRDVGRLILAAEAIYNKSTSFNRRRARWQEPCPTILQSNPADLLHPDFFRSLTIPEIKSISTFPKDFNLVGTLRDKWERVGRAVPPMMSFYVASAIKKEIFGL